MKIPVWLGMYLKVSMLPWKKKKTAITDIMKLSFKEIRFNVAWNIWREVAECGVFLIPFFLGTGAKAIPLSALVGIAISLVIGVGIYIANQRMQNKFWLTFFMSGLTLFLAVGLFVGGCHEFEEVAGETPKVWVIEDPFWSHKALPMVILKPFGYSSSRTVLQITTFWLFLAFGLLLHYLKYRATQKYLAEFPEGDKLSAEGEPGKVMKDEENGEISKTIENSDEGSSKYFVVDM
jgi:high-affinity iron transporter